VRDGGAARFGTRGASACLPSAVDRTFALGGVSKLARRQQPDCLSDCQRPAIIQWIMLYSYILSDWKDMVNEKAL